MPKKSLTESQFYMWRTLFAVAHADGVVHGDEIRFMAEALEDVPFSESQRVMLNNDIRHPQNVEDMFRGIADVLDQAAFFKYARTLVHIDGEYGAAEQAVMLRLQEMHLKHADIDRLIGSVSLELEDGSGHDASWKRERPKNLKEAIYSFRDHFMKDRFRD